MLGYIHGKVIAIIPDAGKFATLIVWPNKNFDSNAFGIAYNIIVPEQVATKFSVGSTVKLWLYNHVTERDSLILGVTTLEKLKLFYKVIGVSGIGPKVALTLVEYFEDPNILLNAIREKDTSTIAKVPGFGKKTAAKLVLALISTVDSLDFIPNANNTAKSKLIKYPQYNLIEASLKNLGFSKPEIQNMISRVELDLEKAILDGKDIEFLLKLVLSLKA